jgi:hypothetical protein
MSEAIYKIKVIAYQKKNKPLMEGEKPQEFEFCCWDALKKWLDKFSLYKCEECKNGNKI